jgi:hypothetical protein
MDTTWSHATAAFLTIAGIVVILTVIPTIAAFAATSLFDDVPDDSIFVSDINWMNEYGITRGCNPPDNTSYCPEGDVSREQMAAFMHRLADSQAVDAGTVEGFTADELQEQKGETGPQGPRGEQRDTGPQGDEGDPGDPTTLDTYLVTGSGTPVRLPDGSVVLMAICDTGDLVLSGGAKAVDSWPALDEDGNLLQGWYSATGRTVYAICTDTTP